MYECTCNTMKSLKVIKITSFDQNQFMTGYLIFNFRPTYFSYFRKITSIYISHNVKKQMGQKWSIPVVKGLTAVEKPDSKCATKFENYGKSAGFKITIYYY